MIQALFGGGDPNPFITEIRKGLPENIVVNTHNTLKNEPYYPPLNMVVWGYGPIFTSTSDSQFITAADAYVALVRIRILGEKPRGPRDETHLRRATLFDEFVFDPNQNMVSLYYISLVLGLVQEHKSYNTAFFVSNDYASFLFNKMVLKDPDLRTYTHRQRQSFERAVEIVLSLFTIQTIHPRVRFDLNDRIYDIGHPRHIRFLYEALNKGTRPWEDIIQGNATQRADILDLPSFNNSDELAAYLGSLIANIRGDTVQDKLDYMYTVAGQLSPEVSAISRTIYSEWAYSVAIQFNKNTLCNMLEDLADHTVVTITGCNNLTVAEVRSRLKTAFASLTRYSLAHVLVSVGLQEQPSEPKNVTIHRDVVKKTLANLRAFRDRGLYLSGYANTGGAYFETIALVSTSLGKGLRVIFRLYQFATTGTGNQSQIKELMIDTQAPCAVVALEDVMLWLVGDVSNGRVTLKAGDFVFLRSQENARWYAQSPERVSILVYTI
jgi:hypothetical protein